MLEFIREYAAFNLWANERMCSVTEKLTDEQLTKEIVSSFLSIHKTLLHLWGGQLVWIRRIEGVSLSAMPTQDFTGTKEDLISGFLSSSKKLKDMADACDENSLNEIKEYSTFKGDAMSSPLYQVFTHLFNHGTYHRGQLVTMFRQVGVTEVPKTDLIFFYREYKSTSVS